MSLARLAAQTARPARATCSSLAWRRSPVGGLAAVLRADPRARQPLIAAAGAPGADASLLEPQRHLCHSEQGGRELVNPKTPIRRALLIASAIVNAALLLPAVASAHARISPAVSLANKLQLYSLAVPTEKSGVTTNKIVMTVPAGFGIDSFAPPPAGWTQQVQQTGSGDSAVITRVTWSGGKTPTGEDSLFQFLAQPSSSKTYTFHVQQTYSDGSIVNWAGPESSDSPAPTIQTKDSLGGGGSSGLTIIALVIGVLALLVGGFALLNGGSRG